MGSGQWQNHFSFDLDLESWSLGVLEADADAAMGPSAADPPPSAAAEASDGPASEMKEARPAARRPPSISHFSHFQMFNQLFNCSTELSRSRREELNRIMIILALI